MMMDKSSRRLFLLLVVAVAVVLVFAIRRAGALQRQHANGIRVSENPSGTSPTSETVLSIGEMFVTYDSTANGSAVWLARPSGSIRSWLLPPAEEPFDFEALIRWNDAGRVVWSNSGAASADLLVELAPETNHRLVIVRITCERGQCNAEARERGLIGGTKISVADDGATLLVNDKTITRYGSMADLMNVTKEVTLPRLTTPQKNELVAPSLSASLILANPESLDGELIAGSEHSKVHMHVDSSGTAVAMNINSDLEMVLDDSSGTRFWDCPVSVFNSAAECTVYSAPAALPRAIPVSLSDTDCGIVISRAGVTWLLRRNAESQDVFPADGVASCPNGEIAAYQKGHISYVAPKRDPITHVQAKAAFDRTEK